ncbi:MAG: BatD family protein, partial [Candidatus Omnitrophota bacterium]
AAIKVEARVDKDKVSVGDRIRYEIIIEKEKNVEVESPLLWEELENVDIVDSGKDEGGYFGGKKIEYWYFLENYNTDSFVIPKASVKYRESSAKEWSEVKTDPIEIEVISLVDSWDSDIKDIKDPVNPRSNFFLIFLIILGLAAAGLLFFFYRRYFLKKEEEIAFREPAHVVALRKLNILKNKDLLRLGRVEEYYVELSGIVRYYIEERFNIRAPEMTTEEFLYNLKGRQALSVGQKRVLKDFLTATDKVKFARFYPADKDIQESFQIAYGFIEDTKESEKINISNPNKEKIKL